MFIRWLELRDFRSYTQATLELDRGVTILVGRNGQGKTNVAEAIRYLSHLSSHRVSADQALVRSGAEVALVRADVSRAGRDVRFEVQINPGRANRLQIAGSPRRPRDFTGLLRTVLFAPEDLDLVKGEPSDRRRFIDDLLTQRQPRYSATRADYERIVRQRTNLMKTAALARRNGASPASILGTLAVWDENLARTGAELMAGRLRLLDELSGPVRDSYHQLSAGGGVSVSYASGIGGAPDSLPREEQDLERMLADAIAARRAEEMDRGVTLVGPHRDDIALRIGNLPAKGYASHGECWSMALSLRLASLELLREDDDPVLILDDVFAELDERRRSALAEIAGGVEQVLVTAAVPGDVPKELAGRTYQVRLDSIAAEFR